VWAAPVTCAAFVASIAWVALLARVAHGASITRVVGR
jgi:hypothetical protein